MDIKPFKGFRGLTVKQYETLIKNGVVVDDDGETVVYDEAFVYITPEDISSVVRENTIKINENAVAISNNKSIIDDNTKNINILKEDVNRHSADISGLKNDISNIIVRDTNQDNRLTNIEDNYASKEYVAENGGKIDKITVNGVEQNISNKTVNLVVPDVSDIDEKLSKTVNLDAAQTITGPKTFTEHIYLANADGTVDRISHLNNNFIIHSGATNSAVLNIDEGLEKIYAFNEELAFKSDIAEAAGTTVYVGGNAVADLSFSSDPQTQINLLAEGLDYNKSELTTNINTKVSKSGDTMTGELIASAGVAFGNNKIRATNSGNTLDVVHVENNTNYNVMNYTHGGIFTLNNSETPMIIQGSDDRPSYVSGSGVMSDLALESDIPTKVSELTNDSDYDTVASVDSKIAALVDSAPETLNTLAELAQAIKDNETVVDALNSAIVNKADKTELVKYLPLTGGIVSGEVTAESGFLFGNYKVVSSGKAGSDFQIVHTTDNSEILSYVNETQMKVGDSNVRLELHGYGDRPYYNNASSVTKQLALIDDIPSSLNQLTEDSTHRLVTDAEKSSWNSKLDSFIETDPTVPAWAKNATKPEYDYSEIKNTPNIPEGAILYDALGENTDGAMTQKVTTDTFNLKVNVADINFRAIDFADYERNKSENNLFDVFYTGTIKAGVENFKLSENILGRVDCNDVNGGIVIKSKNTAEGMIYEFSDITGSNYYATLYLTISNLKPSTAYRVNFKQAQNKKSGRFMNSSTYNTDTYRYFVTNESGEYSGVDVKISPEDIGGTDPLILSNVQIIEDVDYVELQQYAGDVVHKSDLLGDAITTDGITHYNQNDTVVEYWISDDGKTWYRRYGSGWKECGGVITNTVAGPSLVALPLEFVGSDYSVLLTIRWDSTSTTSYWDKPLNVRDKTTNSFKYYAYSGSGEIQWECKGY